MVVDEKVIKKEVKPKLEKGATTRRSASRTSLGTPEDEEDPRAAQQTDQSVTHSNATAADGSGEELQSGIAASVATLLEDVLYADWSRTRAICMELLKHQTDQSKDEYKDVLQMTFEDIAEVAVSSGDVDRLFEKLEQEEEFQHWAKTSPFVIETQHRQGLQAEDNEGSLAAETKEAIRRKELDRKIDQQEERIVKENKDRNRMEEQAQQKEVARLAREEGDRREGELRREAVAMEAEMDKKIEALEARVKQKAEEDSMRNRASDKMKTLEARKRQLLLSLGVKEHELEPRSRDGISHSNPGQELEEWTNDADPPVHYRQGFHQGLDERRLDRYKERHRPNPKAP